MQARCENYVARGADNYPAKAARTEATCLNVQAAMQRENVDISNDTQVTFAAPRYQISDRTANCQRKRRLEVIIAGQAMRGEKWGPRALSHRLPGTLARAMDMVRAADGSVSRLGKDYAA